MLKLSGLIKLFLKFLTILRFNFSLASRAIHKIEHDSCSKPRRLNFRHNTIQVHNMVAVELNARLSSKTLCVANDAVIISLCTHCESFILFHTVFFEARQTVSFTMKSVARMSTSLHLIASLSHQLNALWRPAHIFKSRFN